jgi:hypothetical protein
MKVVKLTESDLKHIIRRVIQTEQDQEDTPKMTTLLGLRAFSRGEISKDELYDIDDTIELIETRKPLGQSTITIKYKDSDEFADAIDLSLDDIWFYRILNSYDGYDFMDSSTVLDDFTQGYGVWDDINEDNKDRLRIISEILIPEKTFALDNEDFRINLNSLLLEMFENEIDYILSDYEIEKNNEMNRTASQSIKEEFNDVLESMGIEITDDYDMDEFEISVADLYSNALQSGLLTENAKEILTHIIKTKSNNMGGWYDNHYEYHDDKNFDFDSYNHTVTRQLDKIIEKLEEGGSLEINQYISLRNNILKNYKIEVWYELPRDKETKFKIVGFDPEDLKVMIHVLPKGETWKAKKLKLSEENFNKFLYQNSLFDFEDTY